MQINGLPTRKVISSSKVFYIDNEINEAKNKPLHALGVCTEIC